MNQDYNGPYIDHPRFDRLKARLAKIKATHDKTRSGPYAMQQRTLARHACTEAGLDPEQAAEVAPWAAIRPPGRLSWEDQNNRAWAAHQETKAREEAEKQAAEDFHQEELAFQSNTEYEGYQWHQEHGAAFIEYLAGDHHQFHNLALWDALRRLAIAWSAAEPVTKFHCPHVVPCPLPPACGRAAFLASLPPGTPDLGKTPQGHQVLQDDLTI